MNERQAGAEERAVLRGGMGAQRLRDGHRGQRPHLGRRAARQGAQARHDERVDLQEREHAVPGLVEAADVHVGEAAGTRLPVATTEASPSAATKPAAAAQGAQLRGASPGRARHPPGQPATNSSPAGTHSAANRTVRSRAIPPPRARRPHPCRRSAAGGPSRGISAARPPGRVRRRPGRPHRRAARSGSGPSAPALPPELPSHSSASRQAHPEIDQSHQNRASHGEQLAVRHSAPGYVRPPRLRPGLPEFRRSSPPRRVRSPRPRRPCPVTRARPSKDTGDGRTAAAHSRLSVSASQCRVVRRRSVRGPVGRRCDPVRQPGRRLRERQPHEPRSALLGPVGEGPQHGGGQQIAGAVVEGLGGQGAGAVSPSAPSDRGDARRRLHQAVEAAPPAPTARTRPRRTAGATTSPGRRSASASGASPNRSSAPGR